MKTLILVRHAKSSWENPSLADFDRPLNDRGLRDAPKMGKRFKEKEITPDILITSPAARALATCKLLAHAINYQEQRIVKDSAIYHADEDDLLQVVQQLPDTADMVMLFGHNPGLTDFSNSLTNEYIANIPTCGMVMITFDMDEWREVRMGKGKKVFFDYPKRKSKD